MINNRINLICVCICMTITTLNVSCTKLDVPDYSEIVTTDFHPTSNDIAALLAPVYTTLLPMWAGWQGNFDLQEESADEIVTPVRPNGWYDGGTYVRMHQHKWTPTQWQPENLWLNCYSGINAANRVILQINTDQIPIASGKANIIAELKTARAFYYYELMDNFGNVPIDTDFTAKTPPVQSTRQQVYNFVVNELTQNIPFLSTDVANMYGRFTKYAGETLLAKVYLNSGVYTGTTEWDKCIAMCDSVIASQKYVLAPNYSDNFTVENQNSPEMIFAVPYDQTFGRGNQIAMKTLRPIMQSVFQMQAQPWGGDCAVPQFIHTYDPLDSRLHDTWYMGPQVTPQGVTVITLIDSLINIDQPGGNPFSFGYAIGKYQVATGATGSASNDFPIFRYADILMMKAECLLRTGHADEAATLVSEVRQRDFKSNPAEASVTGDQLLAGSSYDYGFVQDGKIVTDEGGGDIVYGRFLDELGWEFAAEAHRRQDMIRFGIYSIKMWFQHKPVGDYDQLFPIAEDVLATNPNLKQNPGY